MIEIITKATDTFMESVTGVSAEVISKEKLESWYTPKEKLTEQEELVANDRCTTCNKVCCTCYEETLEREF